MVVDVLLLIYRLLKPLLEKMADILSIIFSKRLYKFYISFTVGRLFTVFWRSFGRL